jgi:hypothetical protein
MKTPTEERIKAALERMPEATNGRIAKNLNVTVGEIEWVRAAMGSIKAEPDLTKQLEINLSQPPKKADAPTGVILTNKRVLSRRPAESAAKFIKRLPLGRGFSVSDLRVKWGMSEETIRRYAREMGCLKFVEVTEDEWQQLVMSPETAVNYDS